MQTQNPIVYRPAGTLTAFVIPKGTRCVPATNLPEGDEPQFWAEPWQGMSDRAESWQRNYGFLLTLSEVRS